MADRKLRSQRWLGFGMVTSAAAGLLALLTSAMNPAFAYGDDTALILGGSGLPTPGQDYVDLAESLYLDPNGYSGYTPQVVSTPEGLYPLTGIKDLPLDTSVSRGVTILNDAILQQVSPGNPADHAVVFGISQGAVIPSLEMEKLAASGANAPNPDQLAFVLLGDPDNPNGGLLERFAGLYLPSLGVKFYGATPPDTPYRPTFTPSNTMATPTSRGT